MKGRSRKSTREKDLTSRYKSGGLDEDRVDRVQRFSDRSKHHQQNKTMRTSLMRAAEPEVPGDTQGLPIGRVIQVYSLFCDVEHEGKIWLCVIRKTLNKVSGGDIVVGDLVKFRDGGTIAESGRPEAVLEQVLPRKTVLTRADSFKQITSHPIVANAEQMLIITSLIKPEVKWGLVDRMIVAARGGGLVPIVCLNKVDLIKANADRIAAADPLKHYQSLGITTVETSVIENLGIDKIAAMLKDHTTVLAGHSGVGKSSLIQAVQSDLDIRIGAISGYNDKGRHTTTSAREYTLNMGGRVIDTPGVRLFGLWGVTKENLLEYFPDIEDGSAPEWRKESYERIASTLSP